MSVPLYPSGTSVEQKKLSLLSHTCLLPLSTHRKTMKGLEKLDRKSVKSDQVIGSSMKGSPKIVTGLHRMTPMKPVTMSVSVTNYLLSKDKKCTYLGRIVEPQHSPEGMTSVKKE